MSHVVLPNQKAPATTDGFFSWWVLTRALLAAGWKYKGSGDATASGTKSTDGNFLNEKWGVGGGVVLNATAQSGSSSDTMTANNDGTVTHAITGATFSSTLSPGRFLTISGAVNPSNNGTFRIVSFTSGTTVKVWNPASVTETTTVAWAEKGGGANGTITAVSTGGATVGRAIFLVSSGTPFVAPVASPLNRGSVGDRITIAGATTGANNGTFMITRVISATSVEIDNASATTDASNGSLVWSECSPTAQTYPASLSGASVGAWENLQGPSTLKVPIGTNVPTGAFLRGEKVTQTTSGATGTVIGCITDTSGGLGFLVVEPRINGTGGGIRGWTSGGTDTVTGADSGATVTSANAALIEVVRELVIWKNTAALGHAWVQAVDNAAENASRFSVLAAAAGVTNVIAPGGATATFPTAGSYVLFGTGSSNAASTGSASWFNSNWSSAGSTHALCATCIENASEGADGSWTLLMGVLANVTDSYTAVAFQRMEGAEAGDLDPYTSFVANSSAANAAARAALTATYSLVASGGFQVSTFSSTLVTFVRGWRRRLWASADAYQDFMLGVPVTTSPAAANNTAYPMKVVHSPNNITPIREALHAAAMQTSQKMRKGFFRWWYVTEGGDCNSLHLKGTFMQAASQASNGYGPLVVGPWDGVTSPLNGI